MSLMFKLVEGLLVFFAGCWMLKNNLANAAYCMVFAIYAHLHSKD